MKTIKTLITAASLLILGSLNSFASANTNPLKEFNTLDVVASYVETIALGNSDFNKHLFADDFEYQNTANNQKANKKEYLSFLNANKGLKYDCTTTYQILDETKDACVAKTTMQFVGFSRVDYVTLRKSKDGWKVSKVVTTYP